mgnify:CR=1 FL=1
MLRLTRAGVSRLRLSQGDLAVLVGIIEIDDFLPGVIDFRRGALVPVNAVVELLFGQRAVTIIEALGSKVASPDDARAILNLKKK